MELLRAWSVLVVAAAFLSLPLLSRADERPAVVRAEQALASDDTVARQWTVSGSAVDSDFQNTWLRLAVHNRSTVSSASGRFYVEYFDAVGRQCFNAVFDTAENDEGLKGAVEPGGDRRMIALSAGLASASKPVRALVHLAPQGDASGQNSLIRLSIPPTVAGGVPHSWSRVRTTLQNLNGVQDLLLSVFDVDSTGRITHSQIIASANDEIAGWFHQAIDDLPVIPGASSGVARDGTILLLVRSVDFGQEDAIAGTAFPAANSPWVEEFVRGWTGKELPVVTQIVFTVGSPREPGSGGAGFLDYFSTGSQWCANVVSWLRIGPSCCRFGWVRDEVH